MKVLLDTSALMIPGNFGIDVMSEIESNYPEANFYTLTSVIRELKHIYENKKGRDKKAAKLALRIAENIEVVTMSGEVDVNLLELSDDYVICTTDKEVINKLRDESKPFFFLKNKRHIGSENVK